MLPKRIITTSSSESQSVFLKQVGHITVEQVNQNESWFTCSREFNLRLPRFGIGAFLIDDI